MRSRPRAGARSSSTTTGDGVIGEYTEIDEPVNPLLDRRVPGGAYGIIVNPVDGSVWFANPGVPGRIVRLEVGANPPSTCRAEVYEPPFANAGLPGVNAYTPRGIDVDRNGVIWTALAGSGHMASFDRNKCTVIHRCRGDGAALRRRVDALPVAWSAVRRHRRGARGSSLLQLGGSVRYARTRAEHPDVQRNGVRLHCLRSSRTASGWCSGCRIRSASIPAGSTAGSMIQQRDGRGGASTPTTGRTPYGTQKVVKVARVRW